MHRYLIRLDNSKTNYNPKDTVSLLIKLRQAIDQFSCVVKNLRITEKAMEFDLYVPDEDAKAKSLLMLESVFGNELDEKDLESEEIIPDKLETIKTSMKLFNEQRYWECHETMEQIWRRESKGPEKDVQQGLILAASALVHFQKDENSVCLNMIPRALEKLNQWQQSKYYVLDVERLKENLQEIFKSKIIKPFEI